MPGARELRRDYMAFHMEGVAKFSQSVGMGETEKMIYFTQSSEGATVSGPKVILDASNHPDTHSSLLVHLLPPHCLSWFLYPPPLLPA